MGLADCATNPCYVPVVNTVFYTACTVRLSAVNYMCLL